MSFSKNDVLTIFLVLLALAFASIPVQAAENDILDLDLSSLMQIQITSAGRKAQNLADVPAAVYVISQEDIHNSGVTSIPEALRMVPGLQVARISSNKWAIASRGFNGTFSNKLLVQIDGRSVYAPSYSGVYWDVQNVMLEDVDRIEIIRGPGATLWGANAVNGVINIITKQSSDTQGVLLSVGAGDHEQGMASFRYGTQFNENIYGRFYVSRHDQDAYQYTADGTDSKDDWQMTYGGFRLDGDVGLNDSWTLQADAYRGENNQRVDSIWEPNSTSPGQVQDSFNPEGANLLARWTHDISETNSWTLQTYYDYFQRNDIFVGQEYHIFDVDFQHRFQLAKNHDIIWGLGYRSIKDEFDNTFQAAFAPDSRTDTLLSAFIQDEICLLPERLWFTLGSKFEKNDYTGSEIQPSVRLLWKPKQKHSLWAAVSRAVRTPSRVEDTGQITIGVFELPSPPYPAGIFVPFSVIGNQDMDAEELLAYETGYRFQATENLSLDITLFYNIYDNLQTYQLTNSLQFINGMEGKTYGGEVAAGWEPYPWLTTELSYSYIELQMDIGDGLDPDYEIVTEESIPKHQVSIRSNIDLGHNVQLNLWGRYVDTLKTATTQAHDLGMEVDSYVELDANIAWQLREGLELMLVGQNLLDNHHLEFIQEYFTAPVEIERGIYAKLTWEF